MKFTLFEVLDAYVVVEDSTGRPVSWSAGEENMVSVEWTTGYNTWFGLFDSDEYVKADGDTFTAKDTEGNVVQFRALTVVRLNEVPELR